MFPWGETRPTKEAGPSVPQIYGTLLLTPIPYGLIYSDLIRHGQRSAFSNVQLRSALYPKGTGSQRAKNFLGPFTCAHTV